MRTRRGIRGTLRLLSACALAAALALGLSGCQKLFTTSLAENLARDGNNIPTDLTAEEAGDLVDQVRETGDVTLAGDLVEALVEEIADTTNPEKKEELQAAAAAAAVIACDATADLTSLIDSYADGTTPSPQALIDLAASIKEKSSSDIVTACAYLDPAIGVGDPSSVQVELSATDYAVAAVVLMASVLPAGEDPSTFDYGSLTGADAAKVDSASNIIDEAKAMVEPGSESYLLLQSISEKFQLM
jgi:hypothetical protein